ncbi:hypothetical protein EIP91_006651 [Steccherinum ochraceum]|uniref:Uncharacterized protein n=1 Tax=Steccherinum ochraceum TaxID=92696 RepID=A0A4R0RB65_9APHY|nr:hypothetical protein EIP91_006651 [Steccherinum ochraceum]
MSLARAGSVVLRKHAARPLVQSRLASSHADPHHHQDHHGESSHGQDLSFPKENFSSHVWGKSILAVAGVIAFYNFAPAPGEDNYISRVISHYSTPSEYWQKLNEQHLALSAQAQSDQLVIAEAQMPPVHRYRYPQSLEQYSPHLHAVGRSVDLSSVAVKTDNA